MNCRSNYTYTNNMCICNLWVTDLIIHIHMIWVYVTYGLKSNLSDEIGGFYHQFK